MNSLQIEQILRSHHSTRQHFQGCYAADEISKKLTTLKYPYAFVVNTDVSKQPGEHWVAVYVCSETLVEYFDSLSEPPNEYIGQFLSKFSTIVKNEYILQNPFTNVCGQFCIYFIVKRCCGFSFFSIVIFLNKLKNADKFVRNFLNMLLS